MLQNNALRIGAVRRCMEIILWEVRTGFLENEKNNQKIKANKEMFILIILYHSICISDMKNTGLSSTVFYTIHMSSKSFKTLRMT